MCVGKHTLPQMPWEEFCVTCYCCVPGTWEKPGMTGQEKDLKVCSSTPPAWWLSPAFTMVKCLRGPSYRVNQTLYLGRTTGSYDRNSLLHFASLLSPTPAWSSTQCRPGWKHRSYFRHIKRVTVNTSAGRRRYLFQHQKEVCILTWRFGTFFI